MSVNTRYLMQQLNATIVSEQDSMLTIQVLPDLPDATVQVEASKLRQWCEKRLATRATHVGKCYRGSGGGPTRKY